MDLNECLEKLKELGWVAKPCASFDSIGIRAYRPDTHEKMRMGAGGEFYIQFDDGWMYQIGTIEDIKTGIIDKGLVNTGEN